jgi:hypothetical protein
MHPGGFLSYCACLKARQGHHQVTAATATVHAAFGACTGPRRRFGGRGSHPAAPSGQGRDAANLPIFAGGHCEEGQLTHNLCFTDT